MASEHPISPRFFVLEKGAVKSRYDVGLEELEPIHHGEGANCPRCGEPVGLLPWLPPYRVDLDVYGEELGDLIKPTGCEILVSERFLRAFNAEGLTGLETPHAVEVHRVRYRKKQGRSVTQNYFAVTVGLGHAAVDLKRSQIRYSVLPTCDECRYGHKDAILGFSLEPGSWDGIDIFRPRGLSGSWVVSERFARWVLRDGFTNMRLTPTEQWVWNPLNLSLGAH